MRRVDPAQGFFPPLSLRIATGITLFFLPLVFWIKWKEASHLASAMVL
jgi:hypothetical protein